MESPVILDGESLTIDDVVAVARNKREVAISSDPAIRAAVDASRQFLLDSLMRNTPIYGVNTGFGDNVNTIISNEELLKLQENLVLSLKAGIGEELSPEVVRAAMLLRANSLIKKGCSGIRYEVIETIVRMLNLDIIPPVPSFGSVGASGDLVPSSYVAFALMGKGHVRRGKTLYPTMFMFRENGITPITFWPKEALSVVNGTSFSTAMAALAVADARYSMKLVFICEAFVTEAMGATTSHLDPFVQEVKNHAGQKRTAMVLRELLVGSKLTKDLEELREKERVKDPKDHVVTHAAEELYQDNYGIRGAPQIMGPVLDIIDLIVGWITDEINSANDNPVIDVEHQQILHTANFMASYPARGVEYLRPALQDVVEMLRVNTEQLLAHSTSRGLPASLTGGIRGLNSGFKGAGLSGSDVFTAFNFNAMPYTIHRRPTELPNQIWVSLGFGAARLTLWQVDLFNKLLANTLLLVTQAVDLRSGHDPSKMAPKTRSVYEQIRGKVSFLGEDRPPDVDLALIEKMILHREFNPDFIES